MGFLERARVPGEARLGRGVLPRGGRAARVRVPVRGPVAGPEDQGAGQGPAGPGQGPGPLGDLPRRGSRRARATASSSSACSTRSSGRYPSAPQMFGSGRARHREHGDARGVRHRRAEGALAHAAAQPGDLLGVLDDRAAGRVGPEPLQDVRDARRRRVGHQRREVVHERGTRRRHPLRHVHQRHVRRAAQDTRASRSSPSRATTTTSSTTTSASRSTTCSAPRTAPRCWRSGASAAVASTTRCAPSPSASSPST